MFLFLPLFALFAVLGLTWLKDQQKSLLSARLAAGFLIMLGLLIVGLNASQAYILSLRRAGGYQQIEALYLRAAQVICTEKKYPPMAFVFVTDSRWGIDGIRLLQEVYEIPPTQDDLIHLKLESPQITPQAEQLLMDRSKVIIMTSHINPQWKPTLDAELRRLGRTRCLVTNINGDYRFDMWYSRRAGGVMQMNRLGAIRHPVATPASTVYSMARSFGTGRAPGRPRHTGHVRVFGSPPNATWQPQIYGRSIDNPDLRYDLDNFERAQFRFKLAFQLNQRGRATSRSAASRGLLDHVPSLAPLTSNWTAAMKLSLTGTRLIRMAEDMELGWTLHQSSKLIARPHNPLDRIAPSASLAIIDSLDNTSVAALEQWLREGRSDFFEDVDEKWRGSGCKVDHGAFWMI